MSAPLTAETATKLFEEIVGRKVSELREEFGRFAGNTRTLDTVRVDEKSGAISIDDSEQRGLAAARQIRIAATAKHTGRSALEIAKDWAMQDTKHGRKAWKDRNEQIVKSLEAQRGDGAGILIEEQVMGELTELLRAANVVEASGAQSLEMPNGTLTMRYQKTGVTGSYVGERRVIPVQQPSLGAMKLVAHKLGVLVGITNDLLRYAGPQADAFVRTDVVDGLASRKDIALIRDDGTQDTPKGARWQAVAGSFVDRTLDTGAVTLETVTVDLASAAARLDTRNIKMRRPGWLMHPRTKWFLFRLLDGLGQPVFRAELAQGMLYGIPVRTTTQIPVNLGSGGDETEIYLIDFSSMIVGEAMSLQISTSDVASYVDDGGQQNSFQQDETLVRALMAHDVGFRYRGAEISGVTAVDWI